MRTNEEILSKIKKGPYDAITKVTIFQYLLDVRPDSVPNDNSLLSLIGEEGDVKGKSFGEFYDWFHSNNAN